MQKLKILDNQEIATLYGQRQHLNRLLIDTSHIPREAMGFMNEENRKKYASLLAHNDHVIAQIKTFNLALTNNQKKQLVQYKRALKRVK